MGLDESILTASLKAVVSAVNRHRDHQRLVERHEPLARIGPVRVAG